MKSLRILLVMIEPPLPFGNAAARWFSVLLKGLVERGHRVTAFAACSKPEEIPQANALFPRPDYDLRCYPFPRRQGWRAKWQTLRRPYSYMFSQSLIDDFKREQAAGFDILHLEQLWCAWLPIMDLRKTLLNVHFLARIDLAEQPSGFWPRIERWLMIRSESRLLREVTNIGALSPRLLQTIRAVNPQARLLETRLGIDSTPYTFRQKPPDGPPTIGLIGSLNWHPTYTAAVRLLESIAPRLRQTMPSLRVLIVGWNAKRVLQRYLHQQGVEIHENVPDSRPYFDQLHALVYAPRGGSGVKVKVQEAFALGVPVVTNSEGAEGMPIADGVHAGVSDTDEGIVDRVLFLVQNPELALRQAKVAKQLIDTYCSCGESLDVIENHYASLLESLP